MTYLYLITALVFVYFACSVVNTQINNLLLRFPAIALAIVYGILSAKGFGLI